MQTHKLCPKCNETKPVEEFGYKKPNKQGKVYIMSRCKKCAIIIATEYQKNNREKWQAYISAYRKSRVGSLSYIKYKAKRLGLSDFEISRVVEAYKISDGKCDLCSLAPIDKGNVHGLSLDHCHETLVFRGFLCAQCNTMLGCAHDNPDILKAGIEYLINNK